MDKIDKNVEAFNRSGELSSDDLIGLIDKRIVDVEVDISVASDIDKELMFLELRELDNLRKSLAEMGKLDIEELSVSERKKYDLAIQAVASKLEIELDSIFSLADFREEVESKEDLIDFCRENMKFLPLDKHVGDVNALSIAKLRSLKKNIGKYQEHFDRFMEVFNYFPTSVSEKISLKYFYKLVESSPKSISASIKGLSKVLKNIKSKLKEQKTLRIKIKAKMQEVQAQTEINNQLKGLKAIKEEEEDNLVVRLFKLASKSTAKSQVVSDDLFVVIGALLNGSDAQKLTKKVGKAIDDETEMYSFHDDHLSRVLISTKSETVVLEKAKALVDPMAALDDLNATYKGFVTMITRDPSLGGGGTPGQMQELVDQMQVLQEKILPKRTELLMVQVDHLKGLKKLLRGDFALGKKIFAKLQGEVSMEERALFEASFRERIEDLEMQIKTIAFTLTTQDDESKLQQELKNKDFDDLSDKSKSYASKKSGYIGRRLEYLDKRLKESYGTTEELGKEGSRLALVYEYELLSLEKSILDGEEFDIGAALSLYYSSNARGYKKIAEMTQSMIDTHLPKHIDDIPGIAAIQGPNGLLNYHDKFRMWFNEDTLQPFLGSKFVYDEKNHGAWVDKAIETKVDLKYSLGQIDVALVSIENLKAKLELYNSQDCYTYKMLVRFEKQLLALSDYYEGGEESLPFRMLNLVIDSKSDTFISRLPYYKQVAGEFVKKGIPIIAIATVTALGTMHLGTPAVAAITANRLAQILALVTIAGAGGSVGAEFGKQIMGMEPNYSSENLLRNTVRNTAFALAGMGMGYSLGTLVGAEVAAGTGGRISNSLAWLAKKSSVHNLYQKIASGSGSISKFFAKSSFIRGGFEVVEEVGQEGAGMFHPILEGVAVTFGVMGGMIDVDLDLKSTIDSVFGEAGVTGVELDESSAVFEFDARKQGYLMKSLESFHQDGDIALNEDGSITYKFSSQMDGGMDTTYTFLPSDESIEMRSVFSTIFGQRLELDFELAHNPDTDSYTYLGKTKSLMERLEAVGFICLDQDGKVTAVRGDTEMVFEKDVPLDFTPGTEVKVMYNGELKTGVINEVVGGDKFMRVLVSPHPHAKPMAVPSLPDQGTVDGTAYVKAMQHNSKIGVKVVSLSSIELQKLNRKGNIQRLLSRKAIEAVDVGQVSIESQLSISGRTKSSAKHMWGRLRDRFVTPFKQGQKLATVESFKAQVTRDVDAFLSKKGLPAGFMAGLSQTDQLIVIDEVSRLEALSTRSGDGLLNVDRLMEVLNSDKRLGIYKFRMLVGSLDNNPIVGAFNLENLQDISQVDPDFTDAIVFKLLQMDPKKAQIIRDQYQAKFLKMFDDNVEVATAKLQDLGKRVMDKSKDVSDKALEELVSIFEKSDVKTLGVLSSSFMLSGCGDTVTSIATWGGAGVGGVAGVVGVFYGFRYLRRRRYLDIHVIDARLRRRQYKELRQLVSDMRTSLQVSNRNALNNQTDEDLNILPDGSVIGLAPYGDVNHVLRTDVPVEETAAYGIFTSRNYRAVRAKLDKALKIGGVLDAEGVSRVRSEFEEMSKFLPETVRAEYLDTVEDFTADIWDDGADAPGVNLRNHLDANGDLVIPNRLKALQRFQEFRPGVNGLPLFISNLMKSTHDAGGRLPNLPAFGGFLRTLGGWMDNIDLRTFPMQPIVDRLANLSDIYETRLMPFLDPVRLGKIIEDRLDLSGNINDTAINNLQTTLANEFLVVLQDMNTEVQGLVAANFNFANFMQQQANLDPGGRNPDGTRRGWLSNPNIGRVLGPIVGSVVGIGTVIGIIYYLWGEAIGKGWNTLTNTGEELADTAENATEAVSDWADKWILNPLDFSLSGEAQVENTEKEAIEEMTEGAEEAGLTVGEDEIDFEENVLVKEKAGLASTPKYKDSIEELSINLDALNPEVVQKERGATITHKQISVIAKALRNGTYKSKNEIEENIKIVEDFINKCEMP